MLRRILNLFISGFVLYLATVLFPEQAKIESPWILVVATILLWVVDMIIFYVGREIVIGGCSCLGAVIMLFSGVLSLWALDAWLPGFTMRSFWLKVLVALACSLLQISDTSHRSSPPPGDYP